MDSENVEQSSDSMIMDTTTSATDEKEHSFKSNDEFRKYL